MLPMRAPNTNRMQESIHISMAVRPAVFWYRLSTAFHFKRQTFSFRSVGGDGIENVYEDKKESYEQSHSARDDIRRDNKADPRNDNKQTYNKLMMRHMLNQIKVEMKKGITYQDLQR